MHDQPENIFSILLGMEYVLLVKTQNYHWNVVGPQFASLHKLFDDQYNTLQELIDRIAEQIRKLKFFAPATMKDFIHLNELGGGEPERSGKKLLLKNINDLIKSHDKIVEYMDSVHIDQLDVASQNLLGDVLDFHTKSLWMLGATMQ
jgi:starvation-inducible DNA-binding protein